MDLLTWLIVGLVAGLLAAMLVGGVGLIGDIIVGIVGAFVGGWIFAKLGVSAPFHGLAGTIFTALIGAHSVSVCVTHRSGLLGNS